MLHLKVAESLTVLLAKCWPDGVMLAFSLGPMEWLKSGQCQFATWFHFKNL